MKTEIRRKLTRLRLVPRLIRSLRKRYIRLVHGSDYFLTSYFGARFLVQSKDMVAREISLQNFERHQLENMIDACTRLRPACFIDIGANGGLYSCVLLKRELVSRAVLFEPDRRNYILLQANLLINGLSELVDCRQVAAGDIAGKVRFLPGPKSNTGTSRITDEGTDAYEVEAVRLDDVLHLSGQVIAVKIDVEGYELPVLAGMVRTLRENRGVVQIETGNRAQVIGLMREHGFEQTGDFHSDLVFEKP